MTSEIKSQRDALVTANEQLTERRRVHGGGAERAFRPACSGSTPTAASPSPTARPSSSWDVEVDSLVGHPLDEVVPEFDTLLKAAAEPHLRNRAQHEVTLDVKGDERTFAVRLTREQDEATGARGNQGAVVTFDDITELVSAQRTSAWADVARRIAHEIKNPLTPIILSAERIRRKYGRVITEDRETFDKLTATIERQAGDIKTMVDEFASFARIPKPVMEPNDLREAVQDPVILFREGHTQCRIRDRYAGRRGHGLFDRRLISAGGDQPRQECNRGGGDRRRRVRRPTGRGRWRRGFCSATAGRRIEVHRQRHRPAEA